MADDKKFVIYNGVRVVDYWPQEIELAQQFPTIVLNGKEYTRIKYGAEAYDWGADNHPCGDCAVLKGQFM